MLSYVGLRSESTAPLISVPSKAWAPNTRACTAKARTLTKTPLFTGLKNERLHL